MIREFLEVGPAVNPLGTLAEEARYVRARSSAAYRQQHQEHESTRFLAKQIIQQRTRRGLSQQGLANLIGTSHSQISRIESGRYMPAGTTLQRIADALGLRLYVFFAESESSIE